MDTSLDASSDPAPHGPLMLGPAILSAQAHPSSNSSVPPCCTDVHVYAEIKVWGLVNAPVEGLLAKGFPLCLLEGHRNQRYPLVSSQRSSDCTTPLLSASFAQNAVYGSDSITWLICVPPFGHRTSSVIARTVSSLSFRSIPT
jgi:hypothetical protein